MKNELPHLAGPSRERPSRLQRLGWFAAPIVLIALVSVLVVGNGRRVSGYVLEGSGYSWNANTAIVLSLQLGNNGQGVLQDGSSDYDVVAANAASLWNGYLGSNIRFITLKSGTGGAGESDSMNSVFFSNTFFGQAFGSAVAITSLNSSGGAMTEVDTLVNNGLSFNSYRGPLQGAIDMRRVLIHEFGHMLGLDHSQQSTLPFPIMHASISNTDVMQSDDISGLNALYNGPLVSPTPTPTPTPVPNSPGQALSAAKAHVYSSPGDPVGGGVESNVDSSTSYSSAVYRIEVESGTGRNLHKFIFARGGVAGAGEWVVTVATPVGQSVLTAGTINSITSANHGLAGNYDVSVSYQGVVSTLSSAQIVVYPDVSYAGTTLNVLALDFRITQSATSGAPLFIGGQIRFNSTQAFPPARIVNLSTRVQVLTGNAQAIAGFIVADSGSGGKEALVRLLGPSLAPFGLSGLLSDPFVNVHDSSSLIGSDDDWANPGFYPSPQAPVVQLGLEPKARVESIFLNRFSAGGYTAVCTGFDNGTGPATGLGLVEIYDVEIGNNATLMNVSTRGMVGVGANVMIGGFIIQGPGTKKVIVRALGPSLGAPPFNIPGALANPTLSVFNSSGQVIATNDNWQTDPNAAIISAKGLAPSNPNESATYLVLNPGGYTAIVSGVGGTTGIGLVEIYDAD